jgi:hypothetical protein
VLQNAESKHAFTESVQNCLELVSLQVNCYEQSRLDMSFYLRIVLFETQFDGFFEAVITQIAVNGSNKVSLGVKQVTSFFVHTCSNQPLYELCLLLLNSLCVKFPLQ